MDLQNKIEKTRLEREKLQRNFADFEDEMYKIESEMNVKVENTN
jgi:hypothetical protein